MTYTERLHRRGRAWWAPARKVRSPAAAADLLVRFLQRRRLMSRQDPIEAWRRGRHWQRRLNNKWNSREFAAKHGFRVPELYWHGRDPGRIPFSGLPSHFVIREAWSTGSRGVFLVAGDRELLRDKPFSSQETVEHLRSAREPPWPLPVLVEEFLRNTAGEYRQPVDYKIHCFNGQVGAIAVQS